MQGMDYLLVLPHMVGWVAFWPWFTGGSLLFGLISWLVGNTKGHGCLGCILGLILGPLGLIITALLGPRDAA